MIVAHHYVVNSGLIQLIMDSPLSPSSLTMLVFGGWGKTGINCFVLITGWFMCRSEWSGIKLTKLYLQITFYTVIIYLVFCITGHDTPSTIKFLWTIWPVKGIHSGDFVSCFLIWYLFIPFLNILINNLTKHQLGKLNLLLLFTYCLIPQIPKLNVVFNYISWFSVLYLVAAYIRIYGMPFKVEHRQWGYTTLCFIAMGGASIMLLELANKSIMSKSIYPYWFMADSNKILPFLIALSSFMWFKDIRIPYSKWINTIGAATFGVLLIHANSNTMRQWLWRDTIDCIGHYTGPLLWVMGYATISVLIIFIVCAGIDWFRSKYIETIYMPWFSNRYLKFKQKKDSIMTNT